jgi:hypothetical protein
MPFEVIEESPEQDKPAPASGTGNIPAVLNQSRQGVSPTSSAQEPQEQRPRPNKLTLNRSALKVLFGGIAIGIVVGTGATVLVLWLLMHVRW